MASGAVAMRRLLFLRSLLANRCGESRRVALLILERARFRRVTTASSYRAHRVSILTMCGQSVLLTIRPPTPPFLKRNPTMRKPPAWRFAHRPQRRARFLAAPIRSSRESPYRWVGPSGGRRTGRRSRTIAIPNPYSAARIS